MNTNGLSYKKRVIKKKKIGVSFPANPKFRTSAINGNDIPSSSWVKIYHYHISVANATMCGSVYETA